MQINKISALLLLLACSICVILSSYHIAFSAINSSRTYDERNHYSWAKRAMSKNNYERKVVGNFSTMPVSKINVISEDIFDYACTYIIKNCPQSISELSKRRFGTMFYFFLLLLGTYALTRLIINHTAAIISVGMISLEPSIIAHSSLITVDIAFAAAMVWSLYFLLRVKNKLSLLNNIGLGASLGFASLSKFTVCLIIPVLVIVFCIKFLFPLLSFFKEKGNIKKYRTLLKNQLVVLLYFLISIATCLLFIAWGYGWNDIVIFLGDHDVKSEKLSNLINRLGYLPFFLPSSFMKGLDLCITKEGQHTWNVILNNSWYSNGTWKYYLFLYFYKTPTLHIILLLTSLFLTVLQLFKKYSTSYLLLVGHFLLCGAYFSIFFSPQVGYRHILFLLPLLSCLSLFFLSEKKYINPGWKIAFSFILFTLFFTSHTTYKPYRGYMLSYFNPIFVDKENPYLYLVDSNIDWGHTKALFNSLEPEYDFLNPHSVQKGRNIFTFNDLSGVMYSFHKHEWLRRSFKPDTIEAYTYATFNIDEKKFNTYINEERTFYAHEFTSNLCLAKKNEFMEQHNIKLPKGKGKESRICLNNDEDYTILKASISREHLDGKKREVYHVGIVNRFNFCEASLLEGEESTVFKIEKGVHMICYISPEDGLTISKNTYNDI
jgi:hypothetical protein